ncbi:asialoglycoprotein receptor 2-like isoform X2 [Pseudophryne corroboree]|uniref:asialoglycoprotein receptor 2-like isoform X2 n=1 Tax=Pseudophryne corroboree TaxID=495146 RepID=UPI0030814462
MTRDPSTPPPAQVGKTLQTKLWAPSWKGVIITLLIAANIILIRINAELVYQNQSLKNEKLAWEARTELPAVQIQSLKCDSMEIKKELCVTATNPLSGCALCPNDWMLYGDNCYYYSDATRRTWNQSQEQCEMMRGHLLVIEDQEQQICYRGLYAEYSRHRQKSCFGLDFIMMQMDGDG